jgi:hypothetical protein
VRLKWLPALFVASAAAPTAAAVEPTAASARIPSTTATSSAGTTFFPRARLVDVQGAAIDFPAVHHAYGAGGLSRISHFDESEAAGLPGVAIAYNANALYGPKCCKSGLKLALSRLIRQISYKDIRHVLLLNNCH